MSSDTPHSTVHLTMNGPVATVRLNHPPMNPIDTDLRDALVAVTRQLADDSQIRACVLTGGPNHFAAGADIKVLLDMSFQDIVTWNARLQQAFTAIAELPIPVIAAINGYALGGGLELALAADVRIGADNCVLGLPEVTLGIVPGSGGTQRLTQIVGRSTAKLMILTGRHVPADEAHRLGILDQVVAASGTVRAATKLAESLAAAPPFAVRAALEAIDAALPINPTAMALERSLLAGTFATDDRTAAMSAFLDARHRRSSHAQRGRG